jgi:two-component system NtrC family sensor kinase
VKTLVKHFNLAQRLTFLTLAITVISSTVLLGCVYYFILQLNNQFLEGEIRERQAIIEHAYVEPLWSFDQHQIEEVSKSLINNNGYTYIEAVRVVDPSGNVLFETVENESETANKVINLEEYSKKQFTKIGTTKIKKGDQELGTVQIVFTSEGVMSKYRGLITSIFLFSFMIVGFTCFWINLFFKKILTSPLNKMLTHVRELKNAKFETHDYSEHTGELQDIGNTLNFTSTLIKKRNDDLKHHSENLEKMVAERSGELKEQILKNMNASRLVAVGEVASGIAHEINNPLTVINGQMLKLQRQLKNYPADPNLEEPIEKIKLMSNRIVKIIKGLKLISRDGNSDPMTGFELNNMIEEIKLLTEMKIKSLNIDFTIHYQGAVQVYGREVQISQVLVNLINNAVDAITHLEAKWIKLEINEKDGLIEFRITDSGSGINSETQEKIMTPFFTTKGVGKGTGLGLSISKGIINEHGGEFYYNAASSNTQFVFTLSKYNLEIEKKAA